MVNMAVPFNISANMEAPPNILLDMRGRSSPRPRLTRLVLPIFSSKMAVPFHFVRKHGWSCPCSRQIWLVLSIILAVMAGLVQHLVNPLGIAVPFWGQTTGNLTGLSPKTGLQFQMGRVWPVLSFLLGEYGTSCPFSRSILLLFS